MQFLPEEAILFIYFNVLHSSFPQLHQRFRKQCHDYMSEKR